MADALPGQRVAPLLQGDAGGLARRGRKRRGLGAFDGGEDLHAAAGLGRDLARLEDQRVVAERLPERRQRGGEIRPGEDAELHVACLRPSRPS